MRIFRHADKGFIYLVNNTYFFSFILILILYIVITSWMILTSIRFYFGFSKFPKFILESSITFFFFKEITRPSIKLYRVPWLKKFVNFRFFENPTYFHFI